MSNLSHDSVKYLWRLQADTAEKYGAVQATSTAMLDKTKKRSKIIQDVVKAGRKASSRLPKAVFA